MSAAGGPASSTEPNASTRDPEGGQGAAAAGGEAEGGAPASFSNPLQDDGAFWAPNALSSIALSKTTALNLSHRETRFFTNSLLNSIPAQLECPVVGDNGLLVPMSPKRQEIIH